MVVQASVPPVAHGSTAAPVRMVVLLALATRLLTSLDSNSTNVASTSQRTPLVVLGSCERSFFSGAFWRLRNHPVSEVLVAKSTLLTQGDVYSVSRIAEIGNNTGTGFQYLLNWIETLNAPQQLYAWKLFSGAKATQAFLSKFQGAEHLYGDGIALRVLQRLKFVLLDGRIEIPSVVGVERLLDEAMGAYKAAFFTFSGELCDTIIRADISGFEKHLQEHLPLLKEVLAGLLSLCVRLETRVTREHRTTLGRWLLKLYRLDTAALLLSPLSPAEQVLQRKLSFGSDARVDRSQVLANTGTTSEAGAPQGSKAGSETEDKRSAGQLSLQQTGEQMQQELRYSGTATSTFSRPTPTASQPAAQHTAVAGTFTRMPRYTTLTTHGVVAGGAGPAPMQTVLGISKQPVWQTSPATTSPRAASAIPGAAPGMAGVRLVTPISVSTIQSTGSSQRTTIPTVEDAWSATVLNLDDDKGSSISQNHDLQDRLNRIASAQGKRGPGTDTLTSMAAVLRTEAQKKRFSADSSLAGSVTIAATTHTPGSRDIHDLDDTTVKAVAQQRLIAGQPVSSDLVSSERQRKTSNGPTPATARSWRSAASRISGEAGGETQQKATGAPTVVRVPSEYTTRQALNHQDGTGGWQRPIQSPAQQPQDAGMKQSPLWFDSAETKALRAGPPLSAGELKTRLLNINRAKGMSSTARYFDTSGTTPAPATGLAAQGRLETVPLVTPLLPAAALVSLLSPPGERHTSALPPNVAPVAAGPHTRTKQPALAEGMALESAAGERTPQKPRTTSGEVTQLWTPADKIKLHTTQTGAAAAPRGGVLRQGAAAESEAGTPAVMTASQQGPSVYSVGGEHAATITPASAAERTAWPASEVGGRHEEQQEYATLPEKPTLPSAAGPAAPVAPSLTAFTTGGTIPRSSTFPGVPQLAVAPSGREPLPTSASMSTTSSSIPSAGADNVEELVHLSSALRSPPSASTSAGWKSVATPATAPASRVILGPTAPIRDGAAQAHEELASAYEAPPEKEKLVAGWKSVTTPATVPASRTVVGPTGPTGVTAAQTHEESASVYETQPEKDKLAAGRKSVATPATVPAAGTVQDPTGPTGGGAAETHEAVESVYGSPHTKEKLVGEETPAADFVHAPERAPSAIVAATVKREAPPSSTEARQPQHH